MADATDRRAGRRRGRERDRVRTIPPGLLLVDGGPAPDREATAAALIALARAARRKTADRAEPG